MYGLYCVYLDNHSLKIRVWTVTLALDRMRPKSMFWPHTSRNLSAKMSRLPYNYMANGMKSSQNWSNRV